MDTNDSEAWLKVNDFLTDLRGRAHCILLVHHEGKNGTQRGRTDGLAFKWRYSKVRHGGNLADFEAAWDAVGGWKLVEDGRLPEVIKLHASGKSTRAIAMALNISQTAVSRMIRKANQAGLAALNARAGGESLSQ